MKLSEMTNDQAADAMIRLAEPIGVICDDEEAVKMIDEYKHRYKMPLFYAVGKMIPTLVGYLLKKRKQELYEIISILSGKKKSEIGKMNFAETVSILRDSYDDTLSVFFRSSGKQLLSAVKKSSAISSGTAGTAGTP